MAKEENKEIVVLSEKQHLLLRPTIYIGSVKPTDEKVPVIKKDGITIEEKSVSVGMYKILNEAIDNAVDEAKRMKGKMPSITIRVNSKTNAISVRDTGNGFYKGASINQSTGKTNIETAFAQLRSGTNFSEGDDDVAVVGVNGLGIKLLNVFSKRFKVITVNDTHYFEKEWIDFESDDTKTILRKKKPTEAKGTYIESEPLKEVFGRSKWDLDILKTSLVFKQRLVQKDPILKSLKLQFFWDDKEITLTDEFFPKGSFSLETPIGEVVIWEKYEGSGTVSFINSAMCTGIHQRIVNEYINEKLEDTLGHHFYDTFIALNLPPKVVKFGDQNKTRFVTPREEVAPFINREIGKKIERFFKTPLFKSIQKKVEARKMEGEVKKLRAERKKVNVKHSHKYFPATSRNADSFYIVEGLCIDEREKITVWRDGEQTTVELKDVRLGDEVITHENRFRPIINKQKKLKECVRITLADGTEINQPPSHRYYVFNKKSKSFIFKRVDEIDTTSETLVRSRFGGFVGADTITSVYEQAGYYSIVIETASGVKYQNSKTHKYCIFNQKNQSFEMIESERIKAGDLVCLFNDK